MSKKRMNYNDPDFSVAYRCHKEIKELLPIINTFIEPGLIQSENTLTFTNAVCFSNAFASSATGKPMDHNTANYIYTVYHWGIYKQEYRIDPEFYEILRNSNDYYSSFTMEFLDYLPFPAFYIDLRNMNFYYNGNHILGAYIKYGNTTASESESERECYLNVFFMYKAPDDTTGFSWTGGKILIYGYFVYIGSKHKALAVPPSKVDFREANIKTVMDWQRNVFVKTLPTDLEKSEEFYNNVENILYILAYLTSDKPDVTESINNNEYTGYPSTKKLPYTKRDIGVRTMREYRKGMQLYKRAMETYDYTQEGKAGSPKRPHIRRGHWHTYNTVMGKTLVWLHPMFINCKSSDETDTVIRVSK